MNIKWIIVVYLEHKYFFEKLGCAFAALVGDGSCDDVTNNLICNFDDGDCCSPEIITSFCTECQCLNGNEDSEIPAPRDGGK